MIHLELNLVKNLINGICRFANILISNDLSNRYQYVEYNECRSSTQLITTGVPQGSILGPLLFLIYINDLPSVSTLFNMLMYADDTTLFCNLNQNTNEHEINVEINKISDWLASNKLSLNVKKTKFMVFHTIQRNVNYPNLMINNTEIERVSQFNFLGVIISSSLKWKAHISHVSLKISRVIGVMYRLKYIYPKAVLFTLYRALIVPHYTYCVLVWGVQIFHGNPLHLL